MSDPALTNGRITLRPATHDDIPAIVEACRDPDIARWTRVPSPYGESDARDWIRSMEVARSKGSERAFLVVDARTGALLGSIGLMRVDDDGRVGEIGYWVHRDARRRGIATDAVRLLSRWALRDLGVARVQIAVHVENRVSQRVPERAGFVREGILRSYVEIKGDRGDYVMYSLLPSDLERSETGDGQ